MMDATEIERLLTDVQREWLLSALPTIEKVGKEPCAEWWDKCPMYVEIGGTDHWLGSREMCSPEGETTFTSGFERLTPLGLQVRQILEERNDAG